MFFLRDTNNSRLRYNERIKEINLFIITDFRTEKHTNILRINNRMGTVSLFKVAVR